MRWTVANVALAALSGALWLTACGTTPRVLAPTAAGDVGELRAGSGYLKGYLAREELPDSLALLPLPPAEGSAALAADAAAFRTLTALQATPRGALATEDANLRFPRAASAFACALGMPVSEAATPNLNMLLRRTATDAGLATYAAKTTYQRSRPFVVFKAASCTPAEEAMLSRDGSYPSGHAAIGWAWALVLTELAPERADALLQRGRAFGQSRGICGVHWLSDIEAGRLVAAATVARLHVNPVFQAQMGGAREEIAAARRQGAVPAQDCVQQAHALDAARALAP